MVDPTFFLSEFFSRLLLLFVCLRVIKLNSTILIGENHLIESKQKLHMMEELEGRGSGGGGGGGKKN